MTTESSYSLSVSGGGVVAESVDAELAHNPDHVSEGLARLLMQFQGKPRIESLLSAFLAQAQEIEDALWSLYTERTLETAAGVQLDRLGEIVGQSRAGLTDADYRTWIRARIRVNASTGRPEELLEILDLVLPSAVLVLEEQFPAGLVVVLDDPLTGGPDAISALLQAAKAAGVRAILEFVEQDLDETFTLAPTYGTSVSSAALGLGDDTNPATGGNFAGAAG